MAKIHAWPRGGQGGPPQPRSAIPVRVGHLGRGGHSNEPRARSSEDLRVGPSLATFVAVQGGCNSTPSSPG
nr:hypothetical protein Itr_chr12CG14210 [Ipomoea trifida]